MGGRSVKTADAINVIGGVPVSSYARELSYLWAEGKLTGEQMKRALFTYLGMTDRRQQPKQNAPTRCAGASQVDTV